MAVEAIWKASLNDVVPVANCSAETIIAINTAQNVLVLRTLFIISNIPSSFYFHGDRAQLRFCVDLLTKCLLCHPALPLAPE